MNDWRRYRPAIWAAMLGIALVLLVSPAAIGLLVVGLAVGLAMRLRFPRPPRRPRTPTGGGRGRRAA